MERENKGKRSESTTAAINIPSPDLVAKICKVVRGGHDFRTACLSHCIDSETISGWERMLESGLWKDFKNQVEFAEAQCRVILTHRILAEGGGNGARFVLQNMLGKSDVPQQQPKKDDSYAFLKKGKK